MPATAAALASVMFAAEAYVQGADVPMDEVHVHICILEILGLRDGQQVILYTGDRHDAERLQNRSRHGLSTPQCVIVRAVTDQNKDRSVQVHVTIAELIRTHGAGMVLYSRSGSRALVSLS